jgi:hypothetical protein
MRIAKVLLAVVAVLGVVSSVAVASEESSAPTVVSSTTSSVGQSVTTFSDGAKLVTPASFNECPDGWVCLWEDKE